MIISMCNLITTGIKSFVNSNVKYIKRKERTDEVFSVYMQCIGTCT